MEMMSAISSPSAKLVCKCKYELLEANGGTMLSATTMRLPNTPHYPSPEGDEVGVCIGWDRPLTTSVFSVVRRVYVVEAAYTGCDSPFLFTKCNYLFFVISKMSLKTV